MTRQYDTYTVEKGELEVSMAADGSITARAEVICEDSKYYRITMYSQYERPHLDYDTEEGDVERAYSVEDDIKIDDLTRSEGLIVLQATAQDMTDMMVLYFFANEADDETTIPAGVYPINRSLQAGTVLASTGANEDNTVSPSIYATLTDGYLEQLYFMVDGEVTVENHDGHLSVEVNAVNSYGVNVHIVYDATPINTAITNTPSAHAKGRKLLHEGQLFILNNGAIYDITGTPVNTIY